MDQIETVKAALENNQKVVYKRLVDYVPEDKVIVRFVGMKQLNPLMNYPVFEDENGEQFTCYFDGWFVISPAVEIEVTTAEVVELLNADETLNIPADATDDYKNEDWAATLGEIIHAAKQATLDFVSRDKLIVGRDAETVKRYARQRFEYELTVAEHNAHERWYRYEAQKYYTTQQVASLKSCHTETVKRAARAGKFPGAVAVGDGNGKRWLLPEDEVADWQPANTKPGKK